MAPFSDFVEGIDRAALALLGGVPVIYQPEVGAPVTVTGMFDENYTLLRPGNAGVEQVGPAVFLRLEDLPVHPDNDEPTLTIGGIAYRIRERQTDGPQGGGITLLLHRVEGA